METKIFESFTVDIDEDGELESVVFTEVENKYSLKIAGLIDAVYIEPFQSAGYIALSIFVNGGTLFNVALPSQTALEFFDSVGGMI